MSRKIPPEEYTKYGKFIKDEGQYDCRIIDRVLEIIEGFVELRLYLGDCPVYHILDVDGLTDAIKALKGGEHEDSN